LTRGKRKCSLRDFREAIVLYTTEHIDQIRLTFYPSRKKEQLSPALEPDRWELVASYPARHSPEMVYEFACEPYKGKLKGYVYTTLDSCTIENTVVQTE